MNPNNLVYQGDIPNLFPRLFTDNQWAWIYRNRHTNGLDEFIYILNNRGHVDLETFPDWLESRKESHLKSA